MLGYNVCFPVCQNTRLHPVPEMRSDILDGKCSPRVLAYDHRVRHIQIYNNFSTYDHGSDNIQQEILRNSNWLRTNQAPQI